MERRELITMILAAAAGAVAGGWPVFSILNHRRWKLGQHRAWQEDILLHDWENAPDLRRLCEAVRDENPDELERLVRQEKIPVDTEGKSGKTATFYAVCLGNAVAFESLLELGADPNKTWRDPIVFDFYTLTEIILSLAEHNDEKKRQLLEIALKHGGDPNLIHPVDGSTPLFHAAGECLKILVAAGADLDHYDNNGRTALLAAAKKPFARRELERIIWLLELGADYRRMDRDGLTVTDYLVIASNKTTSLGVRHAPEDMALYRRALDFLQAKPDGLPIKKIRGAGPPPSQDRLRFISRRQEEFGLIPAPEPEGDLP